MKMTRNTSTYFLVSEFPISELSKPLNRGKIVHNFHTLEISIRQFEMFGNMFCGTIGVHNADYREMSNARALVGNALIRQRACAGQIMDNRWHKCCTCKPKVSPSPWYEKANLNWQTGISCLCRGTVERAFEISWVDRLGSPVQFRFPDTSGLLG